MEYAVLQNLVCLFMRKESLNDQGVKIKKNHKFWPVNSPSGDEFCLAPKVMKLYLAR